MRSGSAWIELDEKFHARHSGMVREHQTRNLEIPRCAIAHLRFDALHRPGMTMEKRRQMTFEHDLKAAVRTIPDYPKPGILFRDITTLLGDARSFRRAVDELVQPWAGNKIDKVAGIEARGFIIGGAVAHQVSAGFVPIRKKGKLPHTTVRIAYSLEYGLDEMEMHADAIHPGERVILVDDLIATGGTAEGAVKLMRQIGADVVAACFIIDLPDLGGAAKLRAMDVPVRTLMAFDGH
jgi:adenine phosphoribosyltransferase